MAKHDGFLGSVYDAKGKDEIAQLYDKWAATYDGEMASLGYRHPTIALALLARHLPRTDAPVLDAGCGTGLLGEWLGIAGYSQVEGLDLSEGMLAVAREKKAYRMFHCLALGGPLPFADGYFAGVVSAGVFTTGHVGAEALDELIRITRKGGAIVFTVKDALWTSGFADQMQTLEAKGLVLRVEETPSYVSMPGDPATTPGHGVVMRIQ